MMVPSGAWGSECADPGMGRGGGNRVRIFLRLYTNSNQTQPLTKSGRRIPLHAVQPGLGCVWPAGLQQSADHPALHSKSTVVGALHHSVR